MNKDTTGTHTEILCKSLKETLTHSPTKKKKEKKKKLCHIQNNYNIETRKLETVTKKPTTTFKSYLQICIHQKSNLKCNNI